MASGSSQEVRKLVRVFEPRRNEIVELWNHKPGWIRWSRRWHKIARYKYKDGSLANDVWITLCDSIPGWRDGVSIDFPDSEYRRTKPLDEECCRWCLKKEAS